MKPEKKNKSGVLLEDSLIIKSIDTDGKHFERVSRIHFTSEIFGFDVLADINVWIYPVKVGEKFNWMLARTLRYDGGRDPAYYNKQDKETDRANDFQYVMYGQVYRIEEPTGCDGKQMQTVFISYGGLLQRIKGDPMLMRTFELDMDVYFFLKRNKSD